MQHRAAEDDVGKGVRKRHPLDWRNDDVRGEKRRRQRGGDALDVPDGCWIDVSGEHVVAVLEQIDKVAPAAAAGVENAHATTDASAQKLIEQVDVDVAELIVEIHGTGSIVVLARPVRSARDMVRFLTVQPLYSNR
jgi:hypothetical protein